MALSQLYTIYPPPSPSHTPTDWFIASTKPNKLTLAQKHLENQSFTTFIPLLAERDPKQDLIVHKPIFPTYIFIHIPPHKDYSPISYTRGVKYLLTGASGNTEDDDFAVPIPIPLKPQVVQVLLQHPIIRMFSGPQNGDRIRILSSIFENETAIITAIAKNRITVLLDTYNTQISIHKSQYEPLH